MSPPPKHISQRPPKPDKPGSSSVSSQETQHHAPNARSAPASGPVQQRAYHNVNNTRNTTIIPHPEVTAPPNPISYYTGVIRPSTADVKASAPKPKRHNLSSEQRRDRRISLGQGKLSDAVAALSKDLTDYSREDLEKFLQELSVEDRVPFIRSLQKDEKWKAMVEKPGLLVTLAIAHKVVSEVPARMEEKDTTIRSLENALDQKDTTIRSLKNALDQEDAIIRSLADKLDLKDAIIRSLEEKEKQKDAIIQRLTNQVQAAPAFDQAVMMGDHYTYEYCSLLETKNQALCQRISELEQAQAPGSQWTDIEMMVLDGGSQQPESST